MRNAGLLTLLLVTMACSLTGNDLPAGKPAPGVLFQDDFSDPSSGWDQINVEEGITDYKDGHYRIFVNTEDTDIWANPGLSFSDVRVEVEATKVGGTDDNDFGVICRYQDLHNFYFFLISSDGYYGIGKVQEGEQALIGTEQLYPNEQIKQGNASNHIAAECIGSKLIMYTNGTKLGEVSDTSFSSGDVGLIAGTFSEAGTDIHFDNFVVRKP
jgi:hypothetical protein